MDQLNTFFDRANYLLQPSDLQGLLELDPKILQATDPYGWEFERVLPEDTVRLYVCHQRINSQTQRQVAYYDLNCPVFVGSNPPHTDDQGLLIAEGIYMFRERTVALDFVPRFRAGKKVLIPRLTICHPDYRPEAWKAQQAEIANPECSHDLKELVIA